MANENPIGNGSSTAVAPEQAVIGFGSASRGRTVGEPATEKQPSVVRPETPQRLLSLDAYRGLIMVTLAFTGFGLAGTAVRHLLQDSPRIADLWVTGAAATPWSLATQSARLGYPDGNPATSFWQVVHHQFEHVEWGGCGYWDLIQPSFMFMVGVALAFSYAKRQATGQSWLGMLGHAAVRSLVLILMGVFFSARWELMNVLTQIGLGYTFLFLLWGRSPRTQAITAVALLAGTWLLYMLYPTPGIDLAKGKPEVGITAEWAEKNLANVDPHWHKNANVGHAIDRVVLNSFPIAKEFKFNGGGYQTINFVPSLATMLFGLMCGELLRTRWSHRDKLLILLAGGLAGLALGFVLDWTGVCPIVKRIWTPSWALFSTGWCCLILMSLYGVIDVLGFHLWAWPLVIVGMNSIAIYTMGQLIRGTTNRVWHGVANGAFTAVGQLYEPMLECTLTGLFFWLACYWLYRQKIFIRV